MKIIVLEHGKVYEGSGVFPYAAWPTVARLPEGEIACVFSGFRAKHIDPYGKTVMCMSYDEGKSWTNPTPIIDTPLDDRDGGICVFGNNVLVTSFNNTISYQRKWMNYYLRNDEDLKKMTVEYLNCTDKLDWRKYLGSNYKISHDGGKTFGEIKFLPITCPHGPCELKDGRLFYAGMAFKANDGDKPVTKFGDYDALETGESLIRGIYFMTSSNNGETWDKAVRIPDNEEARKAGVMFFEPHAIQADDGRIVVHIRADKWAYNEKGDQVGYERFSIYQSVSFDNGKTFSVPQEVIKQGAPPHLYKAKNGWLICSFASRIGSYGPGVSISKDNGNTWSEGVILRTDSVSDDCGYASTVELKDGTFLTPYYQWQPDKKETASIYYTKWKIEDNDIKR